MKKHLKKQKPKNAATGGEPISRRNISEIVACVRNLAEPICESEGIELIHLEYGPEKSGKTLRLYIDKPGGITVDDCALISRQVGDILDVNLETFGSYNLEVSSPGIERPLGKISDFERFEGKMARIRTSQSINGQKNFKGILAGISGRIVTLLVEDKSVAIPYQDIIKARLISHGEN